MTFGVRIINDLKTSALPDVELYQADFPHL